MDGSGDCAVPEKGRLMMEQVLRQKYGRLMMEIMLCPGAGRLF